MNYTSISMKYVSFLFHIYQPPIQSDDIISKIVQESYLPLTKQILAFNNLKFTLNVNYSLTEHLDKIAPEVLDNIRQAYNNGNGHLELTTSGAYHPIFPLIPEAETIKQLELNNEGNKNKLISSFAPQGVFPPEMAFDPRLATLFHYLGYKWTVADDFSLGYYGIETPYNKIYTCDGVAVFLRSNFWSNKFANYKDQWCWQSAKEFVAELEDNLNDWIGEGDGYLIIALDGETFGHHVKDLGEEFLFELFQTFADSKHIELANFYDLLKIFKHITQFVPPSSWSMNEADVQNRDYFSWWKSRGNKIQALQWEFTYYVLQKVGKITDENIKKELNRALFSCQYWWASFWNFDAGQIYNGAFNLMCILQHVAELIHDNYEKIEEGERIFRQLVTEVEKGQIS